MPGTPFLNQRTYSVTDQSHQAHAAAVAKILVAWQHREPAGSGLPAGDRIGTLLVTV